MLSPMFMTYYVLLRRLSIFKWDLGEAVWISFSYFSLSQSLLSLLLEIVINGTVYSYPSMKLHHFLITLPLRRTKRKESEWKKCESCSNWMKRKRRSCVNWTWGEKWGGRKIGIWFKDKIIQNFKLELNHQSSELELGGKTIPKSDLSSIAVEAFFLLSLHWIHLPFVAPLSHKLYFSLLPTS